ncbi:hypothetical protein M9H77_08262 [Catharanthus roseus]|uniref:Uncharacterized protein n=1 Tax=Catharanthus roseus TaxID=4058 RepID=A0ACC0BXH6_CATRO|nr:hypothetical protein M9H77_08262 [Catharanthus roseus]
MRFLMGTGIPVAPATQPRALSSVQGRAVGVTYYLLGGIATMWAFFLARIIAVLCHYFPRFSQGLAQDPTIFRIWFGIAAAHDFESHDDITKEHLYQNIFASHFGQLTIIFLWTSENLFHVAWQGNFESWVKDPLHVRPIVHAIWDPHFGQPAVEAFTRVVALGPVNIAYSGWLHLQPKWKPSVSWFKNAESRLNHHLSGLFDLREYVRWNNFLDVLPHPQGLSPLFIGTAILTLLGGFHPQTQSLWLTDIAHHHLAIAFIFLVVGHMYRTNFEIGHIVKDLLDAHVPPGGNWDVDIRVFMTQSIIPSLGAITSLHNTLLPKLHYILITNIAGFIMTGAFAHGPIFFIRDYNLEQNEDNGLARIWAGLFLGFHTLGLYVHNDVMLAFGTSEKQILIEPIFAQWLQSAHGKTSYGFDVLLSSTSGLAFNAGRSIWLPCWLNVVNENSNSLFLTIGPGDFFVHHAIALGLHTTTLILVKGALDARGSKLMPNKKDLDYSFSCDGPRRGGTCDISAWDAFYLAVFWMLNTIGWVTFYWHWKHITLRGNVSQFNESSTYLMGWLRDYLCLSVWVWMFLFGHLQGYWQELIETLAWAHERTLLANLIRWRDKPVALSIVQARLVS